MIIELGLPRYPITASETMVIFKCPYCGTKYEMTAAHLSFKQRSSGVKPPYFEL